MNEYTILIHTRHLFFSRYYIYSQILFSSQNIRSTYSTISTNLYIIVFNSILPTLGQMDTGEHVVHRNLSIKYCYYINCCSVVQDIPIVYYVATKLEILVSSNIGFQLSTTGTA